MSSLQAISGQIVDSGELPLTAPVLPFKDGADAESWGSVAAFCAAVRKGEEAAVRELHRLYAGRLTRYALVVTRGNETAAAEAVQSAFLKALKALRNLPDESALWAWLARACRTSIADEGRRSRRYASALSRLAAFLSAEPSPDPPQDTEAIWHAALDHAVALLNADERTLLDARYSHRLPLAEIASAAATTERAIEGRLARLREKLRAAILLKLANHPHET